MADEPTLQPVRPGHPHPHVRRTFLAVTATISALVMVAGSISMGSYIWVRSKIQEIPILAASPGSTLPPDIVDDPCIKRACNYLLLGSDSRAGLTKEEIEKYGSNEHIGGVFRSDTIIVVHTDPETGRAVVLHFPRDLWVEIPGHGWGKINTAFEGGVEGGGPQLVARTIRALTGLQVNHVLYVDLAGFQGVVDALGGVPMCVDRPLYDELAGLNIPEPGCYTFDGKTALSYVRARHLEGDCIPDFARIGRQQQFLRALLAKILSPGQLLHLPSLVEAAVSNLRVDPGLRDPSELLYLSQQLNGVNTGDADFRVVPTTPDSLYVNGVFTSIVRLVEPDARELFRNLVAGRSLGDLGKEQPATPPSPANIRVSVFDDASAGVAERVFSVLVRSGFDTSSGLVGVDLLAGRVRGAVLLHRAGEQDMAEVVHGFVPNLEVREDTRGLLPAGVDVGLIIPFGFEPAPPGGQDGVPPPPCG